MQKYKSNGKEIKEQKLKILIKIIKNSLINQVKFRLEREVKYMRKRVSALVVAGLISSQTLTPAITTFAN